MAEEADAYYGEDEIGEDELDLSFLDEEEDENHLDHKSGDFSKIDDKTLARSIVSMRQNYEELTADNVSTLDDMTKEYVKRGKPNYHLFCHGQIDPTTQEWLWGKGIEPELSKLEGFRVNSITEELQVESESDVKGFVYHLNRRQLHRTDDYYRGNGDKVRTRGYAECTEDGKRQVCEVQFYIKNRKEKAIR